MGKSKDSPLIDKQFATYFTRYTHPVEYLKKEPVTKNLSLIVTIPTYNEPDLLITLNSINNCDPTRNPVEIIVLINQSENPLPEVSEQNERSFKEAGKWIEKHSTPDRKYHVIWVKDIPKKQAGVGFARKIAMDEAVRRLYKAKVYNGVIVGLDADTYCDQNYLYEIERYFHTYPRATGANIYFEHPLTSGDPNDRFPGITSYELHLRYLIHAFRYAQYPYAFHTLGSAMAVRANIYVKQGGMNKKQAGEDFYFIHKIIPLGNFGEINTTRVIPSNRISDRVPFGTGKAMMKLSESSKTRYKTYNPYIFEILEVLFHNIDDMFNADRVQIASHYDLQSIYLRKFIKKEEWMEKIIKFNTQSSILSTFRYKFFQWINVLKILRFIHYARDSKFDNVTVMEAYKWLVDHTGKAGACDNEFDALEKLRIYDRENPYIFNR
jgi:hypothetical protein